MEMNKKSKEVSRLLKSARAPAMFGMIGFVIVLTAFALAMINFFLPTPSAFIKVMVQPFIFVGLAFLLYHIGQHVHALHTNAIRMMTLGNSQSDDDIEK